MKRTICLLLFLSAVCTSEVFAQYVENGLVYRDSTRRKLERCLPSSGTHIVLPECVRSIEDGAFADREDIVSVTIPNGVIDIGEDAFRGIWHIEYHGKAKGAPWGARYVNGYIEGFLLYEDQSRRVLRRCHPGFHGDIVIPDCVKEIRPHVFADYCVLHSVVVGKGVQRIGKGTFVECEIDSLVLSDNVRVIEEKAIGEVRVVVLGTSVQQMYSNSISEEVNLLFSYARTVPKVKVVREDNGKRYPRASEGLVLLVPEHKMPQYGRDAYWHSAQIIPIDTFIPARELTFEFVKEGDKTGVVSLKGDTILRPVFAGVCYFETRPEMPYFVTYDDQDRAAIYNMKGHCIIPAERGYAEIVDVWNGNRCFAWNCYARDEQDSSYYVSALCNWQGEEVMRPKVRVENILPVYEKKRQFYLTRTEARGFRVIDAESNDCGIENFSESARLKYTFVLNEDEDEFAIDFIPESKNQFPQKDFNKK